MPRESKNIPHNSKFMINWFLTKRPRQFNRQGIDFSTTRAGTTVYPHCKRIKLDLYITSNTKINSK